MPGDDPPPQYFSVVIALDGLTGDALSQLYGRIVSHLHTVPGMSVLTIATDADAETGLLIVQAPGRQSIVEGIGAAGPKPAEVREVGYISPTTVIEAFGVGQSSFDPFWKHARDGLVSLPHRRPPAG